MPIFLPGTWWEIEWSQEEVNDGDVQLANVEAGSWDEAREIFYKNYPNGTIEDWYQPGVLKGRIIKSN